MSCFSCSALANHCEHLCSSCFQQYGIERCNMCPALEQKMTYPCLSSVSSVSPAYIPPRRHIEMPAPSSYKGYGCQHSPPESPCSSAPATPRTYRRRMEEMFADELAPASSAPRQVLSGYLESATDADADDIEQIEQMLRDMEEKQLYQALADIEALECKFEKAKPSAPPAPISAPSARPSAPPAPCSAPSARPSAPPAPCSAPSAPPAAPASEAAGLHNQCCFVTCSILLHMSRDQLRGIILKDKKLPVALRREIEQQRRVGDDIFEHVGRIFNVTFELFIQTAEKERVYLGYRGTKPSRHSIKHCVMFEPFGLTFDEYARMPFHSLMDNGHWEPLMSGTSDVVDPPRHWVESVEIFRQLSC
jgi:hypothetical protein